jgi:small neutral amino acid transporter SnatA (MarC family)
MTLLIGGAVATVLGLIGIMFWGHQFLVIVQGGLPIAMIMGGILAMYVGFDDIQDKLREDRSKQEEKLDKARDEIEAARAKAEQYREEVERLRREVIQRNQSGQNNA